MRFTKTLLLLLFSGISTIIFGDWSLPYPRPEAYDYSEYYSSGLISYLNDGTTNPKERLARAWKYYTENFIMSNGLVKHLRMQGNQVIGNNEAVSEGIGYGMLLALINNDQNNFNKIFEGANANMWRGSSYGCWSWANGGCVQSGAATDADLDIALALVFADKLQEKGLWNSYNKNGVTYKSRAMEMIKSIKETMVSGDLLLPGDSWGGDGFNNINPSYFSTAAMRVFNQYQTTYDYTAVINKCYTILESTANYNKGQAPDWCNSSGGQTGKYYGMSIEAIRVPWRIGLDALWFNDSRAIKYCNNTKKTLTDYQSDKVYSQMREYKPDGSPDNDDPKRQADNFERVAMWCTAVLGSKDKSYTTEVFSSDFDYRITGEDDNSHPYFGTIANDNYFYYKQSLAMLGYATIFGLFPNVLQDMETYVKPDTVRITSGLKASASTVKLPGEITLSATLDKAAKWKLILTGQTSQKKDTASDSTAKISVTWNGNGWFTEETVKVTLEVEKLAPSTPSNMINTQFIITDIVPVKKLANAFTRSQFFSIYQTSNGLVINAGDKLLPVISIYKLNGEKVFSFRFNMNTRYSNNHFVPVPAALLSSGQYIAHLSDESGASPAIIRRFIWQ